MSTSNDRGQNQANYGQQQPSAKTKQGGGKQKHQQGGQGSQGGKGGCGSC